MKKDPNQISRPCVTTKSGYKIMTPTKEEIEKALKCGPSIIMEINSVYKEPFSRENLIRLLFWIGGFIVGVGVTLWLI